MARGPEITSEVKMLIAKLHKEHPKWTNKKIRNEVSNIMRERDPSLPKKWPSKYTIDRIMPGIRERVRDNQDKPQLEDTVWSMGSLAKFPISSVLIPYVLDVLKLRAARGETFTIREAKWAARLSGFDLQELIITKKWSLDHIKNLSYVAGNYARLELLSEFAGCPFPCTLFLDKMLMSIPHDVQVCPQGHEEWSFFDTLALEGQDMFKSAIRYLKERKYERLTELEGDWFSEVETEQDRDSEGWMEAQRMEWEEYKKEAKNEKGHEKRNQKAR